MFKEDSGMDRLKAFRNNRKKNEVISSKEIWSESGVPFHCFYSQVHFDPEF